MGLNAFLSSKPVFWALVLSALAILCAAIVEFIADKAWQSGTATETQLSISLKLAWVAICVLTLILVKTNSSRIPTTQ